MPRSNKSRLPCSRRFCLLMIPRRMVGMSCGKSKGTEQIHSRGTLNRGISHDERVGETPGLVKVSAYFLIPIYPDGVTRPLNLLAFPDPVWAGT